MSHPQWYLVEITVVAMEDLCSILETIILVVFHHKFKVLVANSSVSISVSLSEKQCLAQLA
jgi:hypothetical protein